MLVRLLLDERPVILSQVITVRRRLLAGHELADRLTAGGDHRIQDLFGQGVADMMLQPMLRVGVEFGPPVGGGCGGCVRHAPSVTRLADMRTAEWWRCQPTSQYSVRWQSESMTSAASSASSRARNTPGFRATARVGFVANGLLNATIGILAIGIAVAGSSGTADPNGALTGLARGPGGQVLIVAIAVGLSALGLWQLTSAALEREPDPKKRLAARAKLIGKGVAYLALAGVAIRIALGAGSGGGAEESFTATALATPGGVILIVLIGVSALAIGGYMIVKGVRQKFLEDLIPPSGTARTATVAVGTIGYVARGVAIGIIGVLFIVAAFTTDASQAGGMDDALAALSALPFGRVLLVVIAIGFIAYGTYSVIRARFAKL